MATQPDLTGPDPKTALRACASQEYPEPRALGPFGSWYARYEGIVLSTAMIAVGLSIPAWSGIPWRDSAAIGGLISGFGVLFAGVSVQGIRADDRAASTTLSASPSQERRLDAGAQPTGSAS